MQETYTDPKAPFNMAIATLMSLRQTLDHIRNIEAQILIPAEERQRIKIELTKRFYVDSSPLLFDKKVIDKYKAILDLKPAEYVCINKSNNANRKIKIKYSFELNKEMDLYLLELQVELQRKGYYMPPRDDMGSIVSKMS